MKTFTFKNSLLKFMLLMITAFTSGNLFAQSVAFTAPIAATTTIYVGGSVAFTASRSGSFNDPGPNDYTWLWSASAAGVSFSGSNPNITTANPVSTTATFANAGTFTITITVSRGTTTNIQATKTVVVLAGPAPSAPGAPTASPVTCVDDGTVLLANPCASDAFSAVFVNGDFVEGSAANGTSQGAIWRYPNINGAPTASDQVNAQITVEFIYQAVLAELDDDDAVNEDGDNTTETENWFAPRIDPDQSLTGTSRRGFVQFKIDFFQEDPLTPGADYTTPKALLGINYSHRDIDGTRTANYNFRETGLMKNPTGAVLLKNVPTELTDYFYNDGDDWQGVAGSVCNRSNTSRYAEVAASFVFGPATPKNSLTFRMGYDYQRLTGGTSNGYGDQSARLYASEFKCFSFPTTQQTSLPVKYSFFNAKREGNDVKLAWQTAIESNNLGFQIERRIATGEWKNIGFSAAKSAHGNSATPINYEFTDANNTEKGVIQYRLKQMDFDMRYDYSDVRAVRGMGLKGGLLIYPNPSTDGKVNIVFEDKNSAVDVSLSDMNGRTIKQWRKVTSSALQIDNLTPGMYMLRIVNNQSGEQTVEKIMVNNR